MRNLNGNLVFALGALYITLACGAAQNVGTSVVDCLAADRSRIDALIDVLRSLRTGGVGGQRISAFAAIDPLATWPVELAVNLFGGIYVGADLPLAAQDRAVWDVPPVGGSSSAASKIDGSRTRFDRS